MIRTILEKKKHVLEYDNSKSISSDLFSSILYQTWKNTPSKNNFMPYKIHVIGKKQQEYKNRILQICDKNDKKFVPDAPVNPDFQNIQTCSYCLVFTTRYEDTPNQEQQRKVNQGAYYEPMDPTVTDEWRDIPSLEVGIFANTLSTLLLEKEIDSSYTHCFPLDIAQWHDMGVDFVNNAPLLIMTIGIGKKYRIDSVKQEGRWQCDLKPDYNRIVSLVNNNER